MGPTVTNSDRGRGRRRPLIAAGLATAAVGLVAACSSSTGSSTAAAPVGSGSNASSSSCTATASSLVAGELAARSKNWYPTESLQGSLARGKSYWLIALTLGIPSNAAYANSFKAAGANVGAKVTVFDGQGTPATIADGINQAVAAHANGIVLSLIDPNSVASALDNAKAAHIPIIEGDNGLPNGAFPPGIVAASSQDQVEMGAWEVDSALEYTHCKLHALLVNTPGNVGSENVTRGIDSELKKLCPTECTVSQVGVQPNDIATKLTDDVENALRRDSDANMIIEIASPYYPYVAAGIKALGSKVPLITTASMGDLAGIGNNNPVVADVIYAPADVHGWFYVDSILLSLSGQTGVSDPWPLGLVNKSNWSPTDPSSYAGTSPYKGFAAIFSKLWGTSS
jgi:ribose transport system substrate-binding protein